MKRREIDVLSLCRSLYTEGGKVVTIHYNLDIFTMKNKIEEKKNMNSAFKSSKKLIEKLCEMLWKKQTFHANRNFCDNMMFNTLHSFQAFFKIF